jgi:biotin transport system substrate-specific component
MSQRATAPTLSAAAVPIHGAAVDLVLVLLGTGLIALSAQVTVALPFTPVPLTGQTFGVVLVGSSLGALRGTTSSLLYVLIGCLGAPVFASGAHGFGVLSGATGGYLVALPVAAAVVGFLAERRWDTRFSSAIGSMLTGNVIIYLIGLPWLAAVLNTNLERTLELGLYPFVPGDLLKLYLAAALLPATWRLVERSRRER